MLGWFKKNKKKEEQEIVQDSSPAEVSETVKEEIIEPIEAEDEEEFYGTGIFGSMYDDEEEGEEEEEDDLKSPVNETTLTAPESEPEAELEPESEPEPQPEPETELEPEPEVEQESLSEQPPSQDPIDYIEEENGSILEEEPFSSKTTDVDITSEEANAAEEFLAGLELYDESKVKEASDTQEKPKESRATSFFRRLADKLSRTRDSFVNQMDLLFLGKKEIDADLLDDLEELLITSDLGVKTTTEIIEHARKTIKRDALSDPQALKGIFKEKIRSFIVESTKPAELVMPESGPFVIMVIGVNGVGKTTTIGKITHKFIASGQSVLLVAADTFRAAAVSQLQIWGKRNNVEVVSGKEGVDPSSVVFDAMERAKEKDYDVVLVDTAGRLHTQTNLMEELKKVKRVMGKRLEGAPHEVLLVLDATTGQNGVSQARLFNEAVEVTGLTLTKLDGTAKGGIVPNICRDLNIPIRFIGIGEQIDDLRDFDPDEFIEALFHESEAN